MSSSRESRFQGLLRSVCLLMSGHARSHTFTVTVNTYLSISRSTVRPLDPFQNPVGIHIPASADVSKSNSTRSRTNAFSMRSRVGIRVPSNGQTFLDAVLIGKWLLWIPPDYSISFRFALWNPIEKWRCNFLKPKKSCDGNSTDHQTKGIEQDNGDLERK